MMQRLIFGERPASLLAGIVVAATGIAAVTGLIYPLKDVAPVVSLAVAYLPLVLVVAFGWGLYLALATSFGAAAAFNWFHIPPTGRFTIAEGENWVALAIFFVAAMLASSVAEVARARTREAEERRREADLGAELARVMLGGTLADALATGSQRLAAALELPWAQIEARAVDPDERHEAFPLRDGTRRLGTLVVPKGLGERDLRRLQERVVPALEALLAAALERAALEGEVVETEALRRSDVIKTALLRSVSHDLRSPLTAMAAAVDALRSPTLAEDERTELLDVTADEAGRLGRMIDNLLDLSRLESGAAEPRRDWTSLEEVIRVAVDEVAARLGDFKLSLDPELPLIRADAAQLERAVANVLENAARHSDGHPVSVRARQVGERVIVRVVDRGPGIPRAQQERVFEPFYRAGTARTGQRGSGLGLAIARGFVEANGGNIHVESLPGQGTTFVMEFPLEPDGK